MHNHGCCFRAELPPFLICSFKNFQKNTAAFACSLSLSLILSLSVWVHPSVFKCHAQTNASRQRLMATRCIHFICCGPAVIDFFWPQWEARHEPMWMDVLPAACATTAPNVGVRKRVSLSALVCVCVCVQTHTHCRNLWSSRCRCH